MKGGNTMEKELCFVGKRIAAESAWAKVSGRAKYCSDLRTRDTLCMKLLASTVSHGEIEEIDTEEAMIEGVHAIYTYKNTPDRFYDRGRVQAVEQGAYQEKLFDRRVRFYGERIAAVVADNEQIALREIGRASCRERVLRLV